MRIVHATNSVGRLGGGVARAVWSIAGWQRSAGHDVSLLTLEDPRDHIERPDGCSEDIPLRTCPTSGPRAALWSSRMHSALMGPNLGGRADVVHQHGIWSAWSYSVGRWGRRWKRPSLLAIRGGLSDATLKRHPWRKRLFGLLCGNRRLQSATCLQALCEPEVQNIRRRGITRPVAVVPNGVDLEQYADLPDATRFGERFPQAKGRRVLLYLGRIHPLKGVAPLLDAWGRLSHRRREGWLLAIAGPNDFGFEDRMRRKTEAMGLSRDVLFPGPLYGRAKLEAFSAASTFVLPSFSEGLPNTLLEAMACGLPLVQTHQCNFDEVATAGAGWVGVPEVDSLARLLDNALGLTDGELRDVGRRGYDLVRQKYTWRRIGEQFDLVYQWMLGGGTPPDCVREG